jgi:alpha-beta hydrolase superfamily lysophospholipase
MADSEYRVSRQVVDGIALTVCEPTGRTGPHTIVMVHGGCHGSWQWWHWQPWFAARGVRTIALDWRSHGESAPLQLDEWLARPIPAVADYIEIACAFAAATSERPPIVFGQSMGGLAVLNYAATTSRHLAAIALLTPVVPAPFGTEPIELEVDTATLWGPPPPEMARRLFFSGVDDESAEKYVALLQPESPIAALQATLWNAEVDISTVTAPAIVVAATEDPLVPAPYIRALGRALGAEEIVLEGAGHGVTLDPGWEQLAERLHEWLRAVAPNAAVAG